MYFAEEHKIEHVWLALQNPDGEDASQIRPLRAGGAGGCDVIKVPLLEDIQVGANSKN